MNILIVQLVFTITIINIVIFLFKENFNPFILSCGIVGFSSSKKKSPDLLKLKYLLYSNAAERGLHSTGIFTPKTGVIKKAIPAGEFINSSMFRKDLKKDNIFIGHVRYATIGDKNDNNAHPFTYGNITGVHNGTLTQYIKLKDGLEKEVSNDLDVDSKILVYYLNDNYNKNEETKQFEILNKYTGAAAMLFYNDDSELLYAYRDKERPLFYGMEDDHTMYISSLMSALISIDIPVANIHLFEENYVYKIKDGIILSKTLARSPKKLEDIINCSLYSVDAANGAEIETDDSVIGLKFKINKHTGLIQHYVKANMTLGYNIQVTNNWWDLFTHNDVKRDEWYLSESIDSKERIVITNSAGNIDFIPIDRINNTKFIPVAGKYVVLMCDLALPDKKGKYTIAFGAQYDLMMVVYHEPFTNICKCRSLFDNKIYTLNTRFIRLAEREDVVSFVDAYPELFDESEIGTTTTVQTTINFDGLNESDIETIKEEQEDDSDLEDVDGIVYKYIMQTIEQDIKDIGTQLEADGDKELILAKVNTLLGELIAVKDPAYANSIFGQNGICC